jgi:hypothetical protein
MGFFFCALVIFAGLAVAAVVTRVAFQITDRISQAPGLDFFVSLFTWVPWVAGALLDGWSGVAAAVCAQLLFLHTFCLVHRALRGRNGRTLTDAQAKLLGPARNQICLMIQTPAILVFVQARLAEILL